METPTPKWAIDLVIAIMNYEDEHGHVHDDWLCLRSVLNEIPQEIQKMSKAIREYNNDYSIG